MRPREQGLSREAVGWSLENRHECRLVEGLSGRKEAELTRGQYDKSDTPIINSKCVPIARRSFNTGQISGSVRSSIPDCLIPGLYVAPTTEGVIPNH